MTAFKILLAEDNPNDVELTLEALRESGLVEQVLAVRDGVSALQYLRREGEFKGHAPGRPSVLLLDIKMPRMDGIETLGIIRNDPALKTLPVVMLSASSEDADVARCYALGANAYMVKPVDFKNFIEAVKILCKFWTELNKMPGEQVYGKAA
ncbi:MAG: response regulator [Elusimicrobiales bacterium]|jgi:two-component system response regulator